MPERLPVHRSLSERPRMKIIGAKKADAAQILDLQRAAYSREARIYDDFSIPPLTQTLEEIRGEFDTHLFLKAVENLKIIGSVRAFADQDVCHIGRLIVEPGCQGQGIGTRLMAEIENRFNDCPRFELFTGIKSTGNIRLYKRLGYQPIRKERIHSGLSLIFLEKTAPVHPQDK